MHEKQERYNGKYYVWANFFIFFLLYYLGITCCKPGMLQIRKVWAKNSFIDFLAELDN